jgi:hypothetical protein
MVIVLLTTALLAGCGSPCHSERAMEVVSAFPVRPAPTPALLFDRVPGAYPPSAFAYRSDWPSTPSYNSLGQTIFFTEYFHDQQGPGFNLDWTYRQFDSYRLGMGYR